MRAAVYHHYGPPDVLHIDDVPKPQPGDGEVLVKVHAAAVSRADCATREANRRGGLLITVISRLVSGLGQPRQPILGSEYAGVVESIGAGVTRFAVADRVFGSTGFRFGAHAEYLAAAETARIAHMPERVTFVDAAAICDGGLNSLWCLRQAGIQVGTPLVVYGASGAIGSAGVQIARHLGAEVTAVTNTKHLELVRSLGAAHVIDYTKEDFTTNGKTYDVILDAVGKNSFVKCRDSLNPGGRYLATDGLGNFVRARFGGTSGKHVIFTIPPRYTQQDVLFLKGLIESGEFKAVVDRTYTLEQVVDAARYVETEQKTGNVILTVVAP